MQLGGGRVWTKQVEQLSSLGSWQVGWDLLVKLVNFQQPVQGCCKIVRGRVLWKGKRWPGMPVVGGEKGSLKELGGKIALGFLHLASLLP